MTVAEKDTLKDRIYALIRESSQPLRLPDFETKLAGKFSSTFDVREAVLQLVREDKAEFTPDWRVIAKSVAAR